MNLSWEWDSKAFAQCIRLMAQAKEVPISKVLRNAARDFAHGAYKTTATAAVRSTPFLRVRKNDRPLQYSQQDIRNAVEIGANIRTYYRWVKKTKVRRLGSRGGITPNPPYPVAKGFARASWIGVFRGLGMTTAKPAANVPPAAVQIGQVQGDATGLELVDRLSYIGTLDARDGIVQAGMSRAYEIMDRELKREATRLEKLFA